MKKFFTICLLAIAAMVTKSQAQISGSHSACLGSPVYLVDSSRSGSGGTWSLSSTSVATLSYSSSSYCMVTGISAGTVVVTFTSGSSTDTFSVTFAAGPAAIGGVPSVLCVGSTATLTDATTGGTWTSSNPSVASINASTGVVYGLSAGYAAITYSIGTACDATDYIYVSSGGADSIIGTSTICPGTTYYFFLSSGSTGTWSTSNASVASVDATTGMVTAVSTGTAIISCLSSGSCGSSASTFPVSVITTPTVTATGGTAFVGGTTTLTATPAGGYWSIGSTSVASIDPYYGTVTGIASGSAVVTYTYSGCGTASDTALVTVAPFGGISGWVRFNYGAYTGSVKVWLIKYSSGAGTLTAVDSFTTTSYYADSVYYQFPYASTDTFRVKAYAPDTTGRATGYMPTYHTSSYYWYSANVINHTSGTPDTYRDIDMAYGTATSGPGFLGG